MDIDAIFSHGSESSLELFKPKIHVRIQQRNGRKSQTLVEGLSKDINVDQVCKTWRNIFHANGTVTDGVIMIQGDQREGVKKWLLSNNISDEEHIIIHG